ncbi:MAG TPA: 2-oxo-4-hydroxy-4-carboxy-5-ureidoimidazoline decarboxylase [Trueperaceae bacterium]
MPTSLSALNTASESAFVGALGGIFECSPWVAAAAYASRPFASLEDLHDAMVRVVEGAPSGRQLQLIRAHPDLAGKAALAGKLTESSRGEQASAGLDCLSPADYARFQRLNGAYRDKFGFPFVLAVAGHNAASILAAFEVRLQNEHDKEIRTALQQIYRIAHLRLEAMVQG